MVGTADALVLIWGGACVCIAALVAPRYGLSRPLGAAIGFVAYLILLFAFIGLLDITDRLRKRHKKRHRDRSRLAVERARDEDQDRH